MAYTLIPINLMGLQILLFEDQIIPIFYVTLSTISVTIISHFMLNLMTASINSEASNSYKSLIEMYLKTYYLINTKRRIKVN